jgi:hypothetical protein
VPIDRVFYITAFTLVLSLSMRCQQIEVYKAAAAVVVVVVAFIAVAAEPCNKSG